VKNFHYITSTQPPIKWTESQAVLNTLTEHDFQDVFKKLEWCILMEGDYFEGDGGQ
jgi:hypothetical protein